MSRTDIIKTNGGSGAPPVAGEIALTRAAQEVQAAMVVAKRFPRNIALAKDGILAACRQKELAEQAQYAYPRGDQIVSGPSIRLAEVLAQKWGNLDFGIIELEQRDGASDIMAYAWDLETNTRQTKIFTVKHIRYRRRGTIDLTDPRDIYEMTANQGARRLRACILGIVPGDIIQAAIDECDRTLTEGESSPLPDRIKKMVEGFKPYGLTQEHLERRLGHNLKATTETELVNLRKIYVALRDNMAAPEDFFEGIAPPPPGQDRTEALKNKLADKQADIAKNTRAKVLELIGELGEAAVGVLVDAGISSPKDIETAANDVLHNVRVELETEKLRQTQGANSEPADDPFNPIGTVDEEPPSEPPELPFVVIGEIKALAKGFEFQTRGWINRVRARRPTTAKGPQTVCDVWISDDKTSDGVRFSKWGQLPDWAIAGTAVAVTRAELSRFYGPAPQPTIYEWHATVNANGPNQQLPPNNEPSLAEEAEQVF